MTERYLTTEPINVADWHRVAVDQRDGASVEFLGIVRADRTHGELSSIDYEAFAPMTERLIGSIIAAAQRQWPLHAVYVRHRVGPVAVGETSVLIGVHAPHRTEAFAACQYIINEIKHQAPIWKRDVYIDGTTSRRTMGCEAHAT